MQKAGLKQQTPKIRGRRRCCCSVVIFVVAVALMRTRAMLRGARRLLSHAPWRGASDIPRRRNDRYAARAMF